MTIISPQDDKFVRLYQLMAERHGVRFDKIVFSLNDQIIEQECTPRQLSLTSVDIVGECPVLFVRVELFLKVFFSIRMMDGF